MTAKNLIPVHQCYFLGAEVVDPVHVFTSFLVRNPSFARQRHADCAVHIYVVDRPVADRLACPPSYLRKITTTMGAIRAAASAMTGEDFNPQPYTPEQLAARRRKKAEKQARCVVSPGTAGTDSPA
jgi:hypothetical protein